jgi:glucose-6-phosphate 1-dehydrogenase
MATITEVHVAAEDVNARRQSERIPEPTAVVIFGASGDLTKRKLLPALFHLEQSGLLPKEFAVVGVARRPLRDEFAKDMREGILQFGGVKEGDKALDGFMQKVSYHAMNFDDHEGYVALQQRLEEIDRERGTRGNRLFYLATAPEYFAEIIHQLGEHKMAQPEHGKVHTIIEKPFGHDLESARALNDDVNSVFLEEQVFRIDHYLGK